MRLFTCDNCKNVVFFDNRQCVQCKSRLAYEPVTMTMRAISSEAVGSWRFVRGERLDACMCANASFDVCNWLVDPLASRGFCLSCRHNRLVPSIKTSEGLNHWRKISRAQQHLFYSILRWNLPHPDRDEDPTGGLVFDFLEDQHLPSGMIVPAMSGHDEGLITIRAAEADDATREEARQSVHELYRTLLGHLRHESGHFIWNKLVRDGNDLENYRSVFGDERADYEQALQHYYANGPLLGWQESFVSAYASSHPWEDFAECFAHYIHIVDSLETAREFGVAAKPPKHLAMAASINFDPYQADNAEQLVSTWVPLSIAINSIQRSMGQSDSYPFVLSSPVIVKLEYLHRLVQKFEKQQVIRGAYDC
ncbi:zinc-binding metallopeptidase family protein [Phyllobacterium sp. P5_D12]